MADRTTRLTLTDGTSLDPLAVCVPDRPEAPYVPARAIGPEQWYHLLNPGHIPAIFVRAYESGLSVLDRSEQHPAHHMIPTAYIARVQLDAQIRHD